MTIMKSYGDMPATKIVQSDPDEKAPMIVENPETTSEMMKENPVEDIGETIINPGP